MESSRLIPINALMRPMFRLFVWSAVDIVGGRISNPAAPRPGAIPPERTRSVEREGTPDCTGLLRRRFACDLHVWNQQGNSQAGSRLLRPAPHHQPIRAIGG